jgi:hypothetical protein
MAKTGSALLALLLVMGATASAPAATGCSSKGMRYERKSGSSTRSTKVSKLRVKGAGCATARGVAATVAKAILKTNRVPSRAATYRIRANKPCAGCAPVWVVRATKGKRIVTFQVAGGA